MPCPVFYAQGIVGEKCVIYCILMSKEVTKKKRKYGKEIYVNTGKPVQIVVERHNITMLRCVIMRRFCYFYETEMLFMTKLKHKIQQMLEQNYVRNALI